MTPKRSYSSPTVARVVAEISGLSSESVNPRTRNIDVASVPQILRMIHHEDTRAVKAVGKVLGPVARAARLYEQVYKGGGRIFYVGAGTSGRLGVLDAAECPPTFGTDPLRIVGLIAGGRATLVRSKEGVEDNQADARKLIRKHSLNSGDLLIGLAASRRTPFTLAAMAEARKRGAATVFICTNPKGAKDIPCDVLIAPDVGAEVIAGSTRMKAGTVQKLILNMLSTTAMVRSGKTYGNRMVDLQPKSAKLMARSVRLVMDLASVSAKQAARLLEDSEGNVKVALLMSWQKLDLGAARQQIAKAGGHLAKAAHLKRPTDQ